MAARHPGKLKDTSDAALRALSARVHAVPGDRGCHPIAGAFDCLLKVRTTDLREGRAVLGETLSALPHVQSASTHAGMVAAKDQRA